MAVSVRSSLAVSLRMSPMLMARMPRASAMANTVAQFTISCDVGASFFDSMLRLFVAATAWALMIWAEVIGLVGLDASSRPGCSGSRGAAGATHSR